MRVELERKLQPCPDRLRCRVCRQPFEVGSLRSLLYSDQGLLQGDLCPECCRQDAATLQRHLKEHANRVLNQLPSHVPPYESKALALESLALAQEDVTFPTFFDRLLKKLEIASQEYQELEAARLGLNHCACPSRSRLRILFDEE